DRYPEQLAQREGHARRGAAQGELARTAPHERSPGEERDGGADAEERERAQGDAHDHAARPLEKGESGNRNRRAEGEEEERGARRRARRSAELGGVDPELLARERVERLLLVAVDHLLGDRSRLLGREALRLVDELQLLRLALRIFLQLRRLHCQLSLRQL